MIPDLKDRGERIAEFAKAQPNAARSQVTLAECEICGWLEWVCSTEAAEPGVSVQPIRDMGCPRCTSVRFRNPEVFNWVLCTLIKHEQGGGHGVGETTR